MITFFVTIMAHCFGRRPVEDYIWVVAMMIGMLELLIVGVSIAELIK